MPTAFVLANVADSALVEAAEAWGWKPVARCGGELIFVSGANEVIRATASASRLSRLLRGTKIYLGPSHQECEGIEDLILKIGLGALSAQIPHRIAAADVPA